MSPGITVVVPVHNGGTHLRATLESLLGQTFGCLEILVIDDGSTDDSCEIVPCLRDTRIRLIRQENRGLSHALNRGIQEAAAPYVARNDQDDLSVPDRLGRQLAVMSERPEAVGSFSFWTKFGARRSWANPDKRVLSAEPVRVFEPLRDGCQLASTLFARTSALRAIGGFRQAYYPADDWDLELRLALAGRVVLIQEPLVAYRFHLAGNTYRSFFTMQDKGRWAEDSHRRRYLGQSELTFSEFLAVQEENWWRRMGERRRDTAKLQMRVAGQAYLDGRDVAALLRALAALVLDPTQLARRARHLLWSAVRNAAAGPDDSGERPKPGPGFASS